MKTDLVVAVYIFKEDDKLLLIKHKKLGKWLPVGGHIELNETPDQAVIRESNEEVGLDVILLQYFKLEVGLHDLALPFYANVHSVGDHNHACLFYLCQAWNPEFMKPNLKEISNARWFSKLELINNQGIGDDVKKIGLLAFENYEKSKV